jgi:Holliday junction resolvase
MTETELQRSILDYLKARGICAWRANSGYVRKNIKLAPPGTPDIIGYTAQGTFFGIEVKKPGCEPSKIQKQWHDQARAAGCHIYVATSVEELCGIIQS